MERRKEKIGRDTHHMAQSGLCNFQNGLRSITCLYRGINAMIITAANADRGRDLNNGPANIITINSRMQENTFAIWVFPPTVSC